MCAWVSVGVYVCECVGGCGCTMCNMHVGL